MSLFSWLRRTPVRVSRRVREAANNFAGLRIRLARENQLHALMLSQRVFRKFTK